jgi:hypothetical protein
MEFTFMEVMNDMMVTGTNIKNKEMPLTFSQMGFVSKESSKMIINYRGNFTFINLIIQ